MKKTRDMVNSEECARLVMGQEWGRRFVMDVLEGMRWQSPVYATEPTDLAYNVGKSDAARELFNRLNEIQPELVGKMLLERQGRLEAQKKDEG